MERVFLLPKTFSMRIKRLLLPTKKKISFEEKKFSLNGADVPILCVLTRTGAYMCDIHSATFGLLKSAESIEANGKTYLLQEKYLNVSDFKRIEVSALFDRKDGFQGSVRLTIQGKNPSTGGLVVNKEIFQGKTFTSKGFICLIEGIVWRIVSNLKGIWAHPVPSGEVFEVFRASRLPRDAEKA